MKKDLVFLKKVIKFKLRHCQPLVFLEAFALAFVAID